MRKTLKIVCIIISTLIVLLCSTTNILTSSTGGVSLTLFESFYVYLVLIAISLYLIFKGKKANIFLIISLLTYLYTYYLANQMINVLTDIKITFEPTYYIYLSSAILIIISLFLNEPKPQNNNLLENNLNLDKNDFIFTNFVMGIKELPFNTVILLINDTLKNSINLNYSLDNVNEKTIELSKNTIKNITYTKKVKLTNVSKTTEDHQTKSMLLSVAMFGGHPIMQMLGAQEFNSLFDAVSNNYDKVKCDNYYEIMLETTLNNEDIKLVFNTDTNPEIFINKIINSLKK